MKINWTVRMKNPVFWGNIAVAVLLPILAYLGLNWSDMTTWSALGGVLVQAVSNPVILAAVAASIWNALNDPTTKGLGDSKQALGYTEPHQ